MDGREEWNEWNRCVNDVQNTDMYVVAYDTADSEKDNQKFCGMYMCVW
jgi:hypothetical protein